ncbi:MAG: response regulator [Mariprofundaceae bacterium]|nr:response regulator [Mariprofundaceae bacterium]
MKQLHHSLRHALTRTIMIWSGCFFLILIIVFALTFSHLRDYMLDRQASGRLSYQTAEFAKHLEHQDLRSIREESDALIQEPDIAGILLIDASGKLLHTSLQEQQYPVLQSREPITAKTLPAIVAQNSHLHLYQAPIPNQHTTLFLIMDDQSVDSAIKSSTIMAIFLLLTLLGLSIKALHYALRRQLVEPMEEIRTIIDTDREVPEGIRHKLEDTLPDEVADILDTYGHLQENHQQNTHRMEDILNMVPGSTWCANVNLEYTEFFSETDALFEKTSKQLLHTPLWSWLENTFRQQELREMLQDAIKNHLTHLDLAYQPNDYRKTETEPRWVGETLYLQYADGGELTAITGITNDITERKQRESELFKMQQHARKMEAVGTLVGGIAHEFNNMLAGIVGNVFLLKMELTSQPKQAERLTRIESLINRAAMLIDQMLTFGRKHPAKIHKISLNKTVEEIFRLEKNNLPKHVNLSLDMPDNLTIRADAAQLKQILGSIIGNAFDALEGRKTGHIGIKLEQIVVDETFRQHYPKIAAHLYLAHIAIADNGCGIVQRNIDRVFDPFFTTKEVGHGTGMGLSMAYGVVDSLGGAITLDSKEGKGTTVHLYLPTADTMGSDLIEDDSGDFLLGQGETILIADDEELVREAACEVLSKIGYKVKTVVNGEDAVQCLQEFKDDIDLALLDLIMPRMGGMDAAKRMREIRPDLPIIFVTGYDMNDSLDHRLHMDHADVITKPFRVSVLSQLIRRTMKQAKAG